MENLFDRFELAGMVSKKRVILPKKADSKWRQYVITVLGLGKRFDLKTEDERLYQSVLEGQHIKATGDFSFYNNIPQFEVSGIVDVSEKQKGVAGK